MSTFWCVYCEELVFDEDGPHVCAERIEVEINQMFYTNTQVPSGTNMRRFVREHFFSEPSGRSPPIISHMRSNNTPDKHDKMFFNIYFNDIPECPIQECPIPECPICIDNVKEPVQLRVCKHIFCKKCIINWICMCKNINVTCPMCKKEMTKFVCSPSND
jgi:hypothetical protein